MRNTTAAGGNFVDAALAPSDPTFGFPFEPYSIQRDLLTHLYETLVERRMTVVESPTGTVSCELE
jgi:chromosome transmission fidelity protein 1